MQVFDRNKVIYYFSPKNRPNFSVDQGETFWVETKDCYEEQIKTESDLRTHIDVSKVDSSTGPIEVRGIKKGDTIKIDIQEIQVADQGVMVTSPGLGPLGDRIKEPDTKIIPVADGKIHFSEDITYPIGDFMIGVIGVSPADEDVHCATPGDHGGNMDTKDIKAGNSIYFPVFVDGANVAVGDFHASMGDGEVSGTGLEISGKVKLSVSKADNLQLKMPIIESPDSFMIVSSDSTFEAAYMKGLSYTAELIEKSLKIPFPDAYRLLSATCDLRISQIVNPKITLRVAVPRWILEGLLG